jgi:PGF-pre-PGF domain-containing protein
LGKLEESKTVYKSSNTLRVAAIFLAIFFLGSAVASAVTQPTANFTANRTVGYSPLAVQFTDHSLNAASVLWDFGDGNNSILSNPINVYNPPTTPYNYSVNLTATNANGSNSTYSVISILPTPRENQSYVAAVDSTQSTVLSGQLATFNLLAGDTPVSQVNFTASNNVYDTVVEAQLLNGQSSLVAIPVTGDVYQYLDIWMDNANGTIVNYNNANITFKVNRSWIVANDINVSTIVLNRYSNGVWTPLPTTLAGQDDNYLYFTAITPGFSPFAINGNVITPVIEPQLKINDFKADVTSGYKPLTVHFTSDVSGSPTSWAWEFGPWSHLKPSKVGTATYTYVGDGVYDVTLTVKDAAGNTDTMTKKAYITVLKPKPPRADFTANVTSGLVPLTVQFTDLSKNNPTWWFWSYGDGQYSLAQKPLPHKYTKAGKYTVSLTAGNSAGYGSKTAYNYITVNKLTKVSSG